MIAFLYQAGIVEKDGEKLLTDRFLIVLYDSILDLKYSYKSFFSLVCKIFNSEIWAKFMFAPIFSLKFLFMMRIQTMPTIKP